MIKRYLTILLLAWLVNESVHASLPATEQIPSQEITLSEGTQALPNAPVNQVCGDLFATLTTRKLASASRDLASQSVGITYEYDQQMNTLKIKDALNREVESYTLDIQDRPEKVTNLEGQEMTVIYGVGSFVKSVTH